jgi:hypothetical protein
MNVTCQLCCLLFYCFQVFGYNKDFHLRMRVGALQAVRCSSYSLHCCRWCLCAQVFGYDRELHLRMQLVICKVQRCQQLMQQYLKDIGSSAQLLYTGIKDELEHAHCPEHASVAYWDALQL